MGRQSILTTKGIKIEDLKTAYNQTHSIQAVAIEFKTTAKTVSKHLRASGVKLRESHKRPRNRYHYGDFANWLRNNPEVILPDSPTEIVALTNLSPDTVKSYLKRRRKMAKQFEKDLPKLNKMPLVIRSTKDKYIATRTFDTYQLTCDWKTLTYTISAITYTGEKHLFIITASALRRKLQEIGELQ